MYRTFLEELQNTPLSLLASKWIIARLPFIFQADSLRYIEWKEELSEMIGVDSSSITFTGSASIGFSLNPNKMFRIFDDESDVDLAIISQHFFDLSWHYLRSLGSDIYKYSPVQQRSIKDHASRLIYWGTIATDKIIEILPFGKEWILALETMSKIDPTKGRDIRARIYKDYESLRAYQLNNLKQLRNSYLESISGE